MTLNWRFTIVGKKNHRKIVGTYPRFTIVQRTKKN